jgi:protein TonB
MEKKSNHNLEEKRFSNFMVGFCFISGVVLAAFSYGKTEPIKEKFKRFALENTSLLVDATEKQPIVEPPKEQPQVQQQSTQKDETIDLNNDINTNNNTTDVIEDNPFVDLGLPKGDTTVIVNVDPVPVVVPDKVEDFPDIEAEFPGGYEAWKKYLLSELKYPEIAIENNDQGTVYVVFIVETDGSIGDVKVTKGVSFEVDREAKRVIKNSPKWVPGRINKTNVRSRLNIPIKFNIY